MQTKIPDTFKWQVTTKLLIFDNILGFIITLGYEWCKILSQILHLKQNNEAIL